MMASWKLPNRKPTLNILPHWKLYDLRLKKVKTVWKPANIALDSCIDAVNTFDWGMPMIANWATFKSIPDENRVKASQIWAGGKGGGGWGVVTGAVNIFATEWQSPNKSSPSWSAFLSHKWQRWWPVMMLMMVKEIQLLSLVGSECVVSDWLMVTST